MLYTAYQLHNRPKDSKDCECLYTRGGTPVPWACDECMAVPRCAECGWSDNDKDYFQEIDGKQYCSLHRGN